VIAGRVIVLAHLVEAESEVVVGADPLGRVDRADCSAGKISPPGRVTGVTPSLASTRPWLPGARNFRPLRSSTERISLRNQPSICVPVLPAWNARMPKGAYSSSTASAVAVLHPGVELRRGEAEGERGEERRAFGLARVVVGRVVAELRRAVGDGAEALERRYQLARRVDLDREPAAAHGGDVGGEALRARAQAGRPFGQLVTMRHSIRPFEMAGAAMAAPLPRTAALRSVLRFTRDSPGCRSIERFETGEGTSSGAKLVGPDPEALQCVVTERGADRDVAGVAATRDQHPAIRRVLLRASKVYQRPPRYASNQPAKSIGPSAGTPMSPR